MTPVNSSNLSAVGYDGYTLVVAFRNASVYEYPGVPGAVVAGLMNASSHGKYFHAYIRNRYAYRRIA